MERRGCSLGCIVAWLGLALSCCVLPYLASSIYSIIGTVLDVPTASSWLWGEWVNTWPYISENEILYMLVAEGPMCCVGTAALLIVILGVVMMISGTGTKETYYEEEEYELYDE